LNCGEDGSFDYFAFESPKFSKSTQRATIDKAKKIAVSALALTSETSTKDSSAIFDRTLAKARSNLSAGDDEGFFRSRTPGNVRLDIAISSSQIDVVVGRSEEGDILNQVSDKKPSAPVDVSPKEIALSPDQYVDKLVRIKDIQCITPGDGSDFICVYLLPGRIIRVAGGAMGASTPQQDAEYLVEACSGSSNIKRSTCKFDIEITPATVENVMVGGVADKEPMLKIYSSEIEFYREGRRRRSH